MSVGSYDVIVVGNGVLGLSLGVQLLRDRPEATVAVVGASARPYGATPAAGAMLGCFGEVTKRTLDTVEGQQRLDHALAARELWPDWLELLEGHADLNGDIRLTQDTVVLLNAIGYGPVDDDNFAAIITALQAHGEEHEHIDPSDLNWLDVDSTARPLRAVHLPREGSVDAPVLLAALETTFLALGGDVVDDEVGVLEGSGTHVAGVVLRSGTRLASAAVALCTGARLPELLGAFPETAARVPRVVAGVGFSAVVKTSDATVPTSVLRTPNRAFACGLHLVPRRDGRVYLGATNGLELVPRQQPTVDELMFLLGCATSQLNRRLSWGNLDATQVGNRPVAVDGQPLVGATSVGGLWVLSGTYRDGLHCSPFFARHLSAGILGIDDATTEDMALFAPEREPLQVSDREVVLADLVDHTLATGYERPWHLPAEWPGFVEEMVRSTYRDFIEEISEFYTPPPELVATLRFSSAEQQAEMRAYYRHVHKVWHG